MSKIGKKPIEIPEGVTVQVNSDSLLVTGKLGTLSVPILSFISVEVKDAKILIIPTGTHTQARSNWGTMASHTKNAIRGVSEGFMKSLEMEGIGYKAAMEGNTLVLNVGFTHPVKYAPREGIKISVAKNAITVSGVDKGLVGEAAASIRKIKKPEPYKGKGIHYVGEVIRRKAGKKVAGVGGDAK